MRRKRLGGYGICCDWQAMRCGIAMIVSLWISALSRGSTLAAAPVDRNGKWCWRMIYRFKAGWYGEHGDECDRALF